MNEENNKEVFQCICGKQFESKRSLGVHKQSCQKYIESTNQIQHEYKCSGCGRIFKKRASLQSHLRFCDKYIKQPPKTLHSSKYWNENKQKYICECCREFDKHQSLLAHFSVCLIHKEAIGVEVKIAESKIRRGDKCNFSKVYLGEKEFDKFHKKLDKIHKYNLQTGKTIHNWCGRKHSEQTKQKQRIGMCNWLNSLPANKKRANYNPNSIKILEQIAEEHGWNIQHAENGGEFYTGIGYFVDAYDKEKNIVLEYDEPRHYIDIENNVLSKKDLKRQQEIIDNLHCEYWRYNEKIGILWKVN